MFSILWDITIVLLSICLTSYVMIVLLEKKNIKRNIILINNKYLQEEDLKEIDINEFMYQGEKLRSGDEISITTKSKEKYNGILIGAKKANNAIHIITYGNKIEKLKVDDIFKFKIVSKYGQFFNN